MTALLLAALVLGAGASITRLITRDSLFETFRERWEQHFIYRQEQILTEIQRSIPASPAWADPSLGRLERRMALMQEVQNRAEGEEPVPWWVRGTAFRTRSPWTAYALRLIRLRGYMDFIGCPWCVGFWVYLAGWLVAWWVALDLRAELLGAPWWVAIGGLALAYRLVWALVATNLDGHVHHG